MAHVRSSLRWSALLALLLLVVCGAQAEDTLRFVSYNSLNFRGNQDAGRIDDFLKVVRALDADVVAMQEIISESSIDVLLASVFLQVNSDWRAADFISGPDTQNALFYRSSKVALVSQRVISTSLRNIGEFVLRPAVADTALRFRVYSAHLKAGDTSDDSSRRVGECQVMRLALNQLPAGSHFIMCGDFNLYDSAEGSYQLLLSASPNPNGQLFDPINRPGDWHDDVAFAGIHTQSTRTSSLGDGGSTGGMDDRFDFALVSAAMMDTAGSYVIPNTYKAFGNDGQHFNQSINNGTNHAVPDSVATALMYASDHLPVMMDILIRSEASPVTERPAPATTFQLLNCYPNPFNPLLTVELSAAAGPGEIAIYDVLGRPVMSQQVKDAGNAHAFSFDFTGHGTGTYFVRWAGTRGGDMQKVMYVR